ncbi:MAG: type II toxin-antitoxin system VapC family toxin [Candidatus Omnitrophica bacterium]|nr:type II toxin-antitoxin system VapC family toxin [Candidatus Omnitrophota bacterium]
MIESVFVDSFSWIALINKSDNHHEVSLKTIEDFLNKQVKLITTNYVVIETINALSKVEFRKAVIEFIDKLEKSPSVEIVKITDEIYNNAWRLYQQRMDKDWGIIDCTSFEVMRIFNLKKAFTNDKHFKQAGYSLVIK